MAVFCRAFPLRWQFPNGKYFLRRDTAELQNVALESRREINIYEVIKMGFV